MYPYVVIAVSAWLVAQVGKFLRNAWIGKVRFQYMYNSGGMPSAHSATICALATTVLIYEGLNSSLFGVTAVITAIVIYDALGVRRSSGDQAIAINAIADFLNTSGKNQIQLLRLREVLGHKPSEVAVGALIGVMVALVATASHWSTKLDFLMQAPGSTERWIYLSSFSLMILSALFIRLRLSRRFTKQVPALKRLRTVMVVSLSSFGLMGLFFSLLQFESVMNGNLRVWPLLILGLFLGVQSYLWARIYRKARQEILVEVLASRRIKKTRAKKRKARR